MKILSKDSKIYIELNISEGVLVQKELSSENAGKLLRELKSILMKIKPTEV